jgi:NADH-quinone oxidoreductase subunit E
MKVLSEQVRRDIEEMMAAYPKPRSAILGALHRVQEELGWVPPQAQEEVAEMFGMAPAEVDSLVTFYYMYFRKPVGRYVLKVCRSISCYLRGCDGLTRHLLQRLGLKKPGETTPDGLFTVVEAECLAACGGAPVLQVNDRFFENATLERVDQLLEDLRAGRSPFPPGPPAWTPDAAMQGAS